MSRAMVESDETVSRMVLDVLRSRFESEERTGTHVSDLVFPRKSWISKRCPKTLSDEECLYFIAGRAHHEIVEGLIAEKRLTEVHLEWNGITGTVDAVSNEHPVEFKTTRAQSAYGTEGVPGHYLLQLGMYVAMMNPTAKTGEGTLLVLYLSQKNGIGRRRVPKLSSFTVKYDDLDHIRNLMTQRKAMVEGDTPPPVSLCEEWLCRACRYHKQECEGWA